MAKEVIVSAKKIKKRKQFFKITKIVLACLLLFLIFAFIILNIIYKGGRFTVTLDKRLGLDSKIVLYEDNEIKEEKRKLEARDLEFMDNRLDTTKYW